MDLPALSQRLGVPVVGTAAGRQEGLDELKGAIARLVEGDAPAAARREPRERVTLAERYAAQVVRGERADRLRRQRRLDRLLTSKSTGIPLMLLLFGLVVWLTVAGANIPSALLTQLFARLGGVLENCRKMGEVVRAKLNALKDKYSVIGDVRGVGLMNAMEFVKPEDNAPDGALCAAVQAEALKRNLLLLNCGADHNNVRLIPPLNVDEATLDIAFQIIDESIAAALKA